MTNILIGTAVSLGASALSALFAPSRTIRNRIERNKQDNFTRPRASEGDNISKVWGRGRVGGILLYADFPPEERVSEKVTPTRQGGKGGGGTTTVTEERTYSYWGSCAFILCGKTTQIDEIRFNSKLVWKDGQLQPILDSSGCNFRIYNGTPDQALDSLLEVKLGDLAIPYRNRTILVCENLPLAEFGDAYPQCSALVSNGTPTLADIVEEICLESPFLSANDLDLSDIDDINVDGFQVDSQSSIAEQLTQLQNCYFFDLIDNGISLKFQKQFRPTATFINPAALGSRQEDDQSPRRYVESRQDTTQLPTQIEIKFYDKNNNLLEGIARSVTFPTATHINRQTIDFSGVLENSSAVDIANKLLWIAWTRSYTQKLSLSPSYVNLEPGDVIEIEIDGQNQQIQVSEVEIGANHLVLVKSWTYNAAVYGWEQTLTSETDFEPSPIPDPVIPPVDTPLPTVSPTTLRVLDIPLAYPTDTPGIYAFADGDENWRNATLYISRDLGVTYDFAGTFVTRSLFGICQTTFNGTLVDVRVPFHASLASISEALFLEGRNRSLIGSEIVDFRNATLTGNSGTDKIYQLTAPFTRGLSGTSQAHGANETFYLLSGYKLNLPAQRSDIGKTFYFKAVSPGQTLADVSPVTLVFAGKAFQVAIDDFSPRQGAIGATVTITGLGFTGATAVSFNNVAAQSFTVVNDTTITAVVATGTTTGKIRVTAPLGIGVSAVDFTVVLPSTLTIQEEGVAVATNRQTLNFIGSTVTAVDNPTNNRVDITVQPPPTTNLSSSPILITRHIDNLAAKPYFLDVSAPFSYQIDGISLQAIAGSATAAVEINNVAVPGLNNLSISTTLLNATVTINNIVAQGQRVRLNVASSTATDVGLTLAISRNTVNNASGGTVTIVNGQIIHTFSASGSFTCTATITAQVLVVAGGGGGGAGVCGAAGGGGAGGVFLGTVTLAAGTYSVVVGQGGLGTSPDPFSIPSQNGQNSSLGNLIECIGGGGGGGVLALAASGGSGGGSGVGGSRNPAVVLPGGVGTLNQGNKGGDGDTGGNPHIAGGGGGAGSAGGNRSSGKGGSGIFSSISGVSSLYACGGGGGAHNTSPPGVGDQNNSGGQDSVGQTPPANTGSGGGGGAFNCSQTRNGGNGASGIVIISYSI